MTTSKRRKCERVRAVSADPMSRCTEMTKKPIVLLQGSNLTSAAQLAMMFVEARKYFAQFGLAQPPLPGAAAGFVGCDFLVTETAGANGERLGKVTLAASTGDVRYEQDWVIAPGR